MPSIDPALIEYAHVLVEFAAGEHETPNGQWELNCLTRDGWAVASQSVTGPRSMIVTLWRQRREY